MGTMLVVTALVIPMLVMATTNHDDAPEDDLLNLFEEQIDSDVLVDGLNEQIEEGKANDITVMGKWGYGREQTADGFFAAKLFRRGRVGVFKGVYNVSGEDERTPIVLLLKKGYIVGKIITDSGPVKVTGLYSIDREQELLKMQWMTPGKAGWAVGKISIIT